MGFLRGILGIFWGLEGIFFVFWGILGGIFGNSERSFLGFLWGLLGFLKAILGIFFEGFFGNSEGSFWGKKGGKIKPERTLMTASAWPGRKDSNPKIFRASKTSSGGSVEFKKVKI